MPPVAAGTRPALQNTDPNAVISTARVDALRADFETNRSYRLMQNAVSQVKLDDVALNRAVVVQTDHTFSHVLDDWDVTNQKQSGRCWMFAGLNLIRVGAMKAMNLKDFEFSQNYTFFWDKFERSNYFLEAMIEMATRDVDDRTVAWLLERPVDDGGQWNMFVNIVAKYGLVPKAAMPETESSSCTPRMNANLVRLLRQGAHELRAAAAKGADVAELRREKERILEIVWRLLNIHLGTPPKSFHWQWNDKDREFGSDGEMTPQEFAGKYVSQNLGDYVCLVHDPRDSSPRGRTFTVDCLGNVVGGESVKYLNVEMATMKNAAMRTLLDGEPVWMGCDVAKQMRKDLGIWDVDLYDYEAVYDAEFHLDKEHRLLYHDTLMTHAMLFTGVDVVEESGTKVPRRWRVENSWGEKNGRKGFYVMNDSWFDEYMFEIAVRREYLSDELQQALEQEPIVLPAWDPMGSLARGGS